MKQKTKKTQIRYYKVVRRNSKYNKYIKWFLEQYRDEKGEDLLSSSGYRTQREARSKIRDHDFHIGRGQTVRVKYKEID